MAFFWNYYWPGGLLLFKPLFSAPGILINHKEHCEAKISTVSAQQRHFFIEDTVTSHAGKTREPHFGGGVFMNVLMVFSQATNVRNATRAKMSALIKYVAEINQPPVAINICSRKQT
jgi:hypothetical protein